MLAVGVAAVGSFGPSNDYHVEGNVVLDLTVMLAVRDKEVDKAGSNPEQLSS